MESNGQKGRVHVSEATANLLKEAGHDDWISPREELVEAKGKGSLQTFWVSKSVFSEGQETVVTSGSYSGEGSDHDEESVCPPDTERYDI
jgi:Adenylate and Guanylate cyclase catalytic domain